MAGRAAAATSPTAGQRAWELALEADRLQFGTQRDRAVAPEPGEDDALVTDIRRPRAGRAARRRAVRTGRVVRCSDEAADNDATSAVDGSDAKAALESTDDAALRRSASGWDALAVIGDVSTELGGYLSELPGRRSTLDTVGPTG
jgi:DNA repair protein RecN (Recombination protein N)